MSYMCYCLQNGNHQRLQNTESPCISTCTTATNLSSLGDFQSNTAVNQKKMNKDNNLRMVIQEIEPLQKKQDVEESPEEAKKLEFSHFSSQVSFTKHTFIYFAIIDIDC